MKSCLIVDDSKVIRSIAANILKDLHIETSEAENGEEALDACRQSMPDLVLMDWHMPVMNGLECLHQIRGLPGGDQPIVVFCTTENDVERISEAVNAGANEFIMKPFDSEILRSKLETVGVL